MAEYATNFGIFKASDNQITAKVWVALAGVGMPQGVQVLALETVTHTTVTTDPDGSYASSTPLDVPRRMALRHVEPFIAELQRSGVSPSRANVSLIGAPIFETDGRPENFAQWVALRRRISSKSRTQYCEHSGGQT